jgi:hypothetical protein
MEDEVGMTAEHKDRRLGFAMVVVSRHCLRVDVRLTHPKFSEPTVRPLIAAKRCMPSLCAVSASMSADLT